MRKPIPSSFVMRIARILTPRVALPASIRGGRAFLKIVPLLALTGVLIVLGICAPQVALAEEPSTTTRFRNVV